MLTNLIMVIISQYKHTSNHHVIHPSLHNIVCQLYHNKVWRGTCSKGYKKGYLVRMPTMHPKHKEILLK